MSDSIGFLLGDASRLLRRRFDQDARAIGVTRPQWRVLFALSRMEGVNQGGLAEQLEVEAITLCRMVDRLQEADLVERRADPADRRAWRLFLTDKARPLLSTMHDIGDRLIEEALAGLDAPAREALTEALGLIRTNLAARPTDGDLKTGAAR